MGSSYEFFLALRYLKFHRGKTFLSVITLISVAGVAVGSAALVVALALMAGFLEDVRERIHSGSAHLTVLGGDLESYMDMDAVLAETRAIDGVAAAGPVVFTPGMITVPELETNAYAEVQGIDPRVHGEVLIRDETSGDPFLILAEPTSSGRDGIVLGARLAARLGVYEGSMVRVVVPRVTLTPWSPEPRSRVFEVVGTYRSDHFQQDTQRAYVAIDAARKVLRAKGLSSWVEVRLHDIRRLDPMKGLLRERFGASWHVVDLIEQNQDLFKALNIEKLALFLAIGLIVVVASLNNVSTLILMVNDKIREIGTLSALGARPDGIARVFVFQGLIIGSVGTTCGVVFGTALSLCLDRFELIQLNPEVYYLTHLPFRTQPLDVIAVAVAAILISLLATVYPAMKAARLDPVEALRYE